MNTLNEQLDQLWGQLPDITTHYISYLRMMEYDLKYPEQYQDMIEAILMLWWAEHE